MTTDEQKEKGIRLKNHWKLDNRRTSDHPTFGKAVDVILPQMQRWDSEIPTKPGRNLDKLRDHIKVILVNLYYVYTQDNERYVSFKRGRSEYKHESGYRGFQFGYLNVRRTVDFLRANGYIEHHMGIPGYEEHEAKSPKMKAVRKLVDLIERGIKDKSAIKVSFVWKHDELIVMKGKKPKPKKVVKVDKKTGKKITKTVKRKRPIVKTPDNRQVRQWRTNLKFINSIYDRSDITLDITDDELRKLNRQLCGNRDRYKRAIDFQKKYLRRIFVDSRLDRGGRFYGAWYQGIPEEYRARILINGRPTVEVDYSGLHPSICYALNKLPFPGDPYHLDSYPKTKLMREFLKAFLLIMINVKDERSAFRGLLNKNRKGKLKLPPEVHSFSDDDLRRVKNQLLKKHQPIDNYLLKDKGNQLMNTDSQIAESIMGHFALKGFPCLSVYDSFIVDFSLQDELQDVMKTTFEGALHQIITTDDNLDLMILGLDWGGVILPGLAKRIKDGDFSDDEMGYLIDVLNELEDVPPVVKESQEALKQVYDRITTADDPPGR